MGERLACVIGDLDLVQPLGLAGIDVVMAANTMAEVRWSRHVSSTFKLGSFWTESEAAVEGLISFARSQERRPMLFYQTDAAVMAVSRHRDQLAPHFDFVIPDANLVNDLADKSRFSALAARLGIPTPHTTMLVGGEEATDLDALTYPVVVKPAVRDHGDLWSEATGAAKAIRCGSAEDLTQFLAQPCMDGLVLLVQDEISGPETAICSYHAWIDPGGNTRAEFTGRKIRTWPAEFGVSTAVEITEDAEVLEVGRRTLKALDFTGVAKIDFKRDQAGELLVLEVNPRFSLWHHPAARAGVNIPAMIADYLSGAPVRGYHVKPGVCWCNPWKDAVAARRQGSGAFSWLRFLLSTDARYAGHLDDPGASVGWLAHRVRMLNH